VHLTLVEDMVFPDVLRSSLAVQHMVRSGAVSAVEERHVVLTATKSDDPVLLLAFFPFEACIQSPCALSWVLPRHVPCVFVPPAHCPSVVCGGDGDVKSVMLPVVPMPLLLLTASALPSSFSCCAPLSNSLLQ
jgi:hypothetical protein